MAEIQSDTFAKMSYFIVYYQMLTDTTYRDLYSKK